MAFRHFFSISVVAAAVLSGCGPSDSTENGVRYVERAYVKKNADATATMYVGQEKIELRSLSQQVVNDAEPLAATDGWMTCNSCSVSLASQTADCGECLRTADHDHACDGHVEN